MTCMWTESLGTCIENKIDNIQMQCENKSKEEPDEYGRAYCSIHRKMVDEINKSRHKNCINKEKLVSFLSEFYNNFNQVEDKWFQSKADTYANILEYLESNEFYNE